jgi:hypothetical protein
VLNEIAGPGQNPGPALHWIESSQIARFSRTRRQAVEQWQADIRQPSKFQALPLSGQELRSAREARRDH